MSRKNARIMKLQAELNTEVKNMYEIVNYLNEFHNKLAKVRGRIDSIQEQLGILGIVDDNLELTEED